MSTWYHIVYFIYAHTWIQLEERMKWDEMRSCHIMSCYVIMSCRHGWFWLSHLAMFDVLKLLKSQVRLRRYPGGVFIGHLPPGTSEAPCLYAEASESRSYKARPPAWSIGINHVFKTLSSPLYGVWLRTGLLVDSDYPQYIWLVSSQTDLRSTIVYQCFFCFNLIRIIAIYIHIFVVKTPMKWLIHQKGHTTSSHSPSVSPVQRQATFGASSVHGRNSQGRAFHLSSESSNPLVPEQTWSSRETMSKWNCFTDKSSQKRIQPS